MSYSAKEKWNSPEWVENWLKKIEFIDTAKQFSKLPRIVQERAKDKSYKVIELGSGSGRWSQYFANYVGLDVSEALLEVARENFADRLFLEFNYAKKQLPNYFPNQLPFIENEPFGYRLAFEPYGEVNLIFSWCGLLQMNPEDFAKLELPKCDYLFVEPAKQLEVKYSHVHDYESKFGVKPVGEIGNLTIFTNIEVK